MKVHAEDGVCSLVAPVTHWAWSPDDAYLAAALVVANEPGGTLLAVIEAETGRAVMAVRGGEIEGLGWASPEHLLVSREEGFSARAVLHAVPDGAVLGSLALPMLGGGRHRVMAATRRGDAPEVVVVAPMRWHGGAAPRARHRAAYVVRLEPFGIVREITPSTWRVLPRLPHLRAAVAALDPDGARLTFWLAEPDARGEPGEAPGHVVNYTWDDDRPTIVGRAGRRVVELLPCDPTRLVLRESHGERLEDRGDLTVVDTRRGAVLVSTHDETDTLGPSATMDLHPDRERVLVAGRSFEGRATVGTLRVFDVGAGIATGAPTSVRSAAGAVWRREGEGLWVLLARGSTASVAASPDLPRGAWRDPAARGISLAGTNPSRPRLLWSAARRWLTVAWQCLPARARAIERVLGPTRLAWLPGESRTPDG